MSCTILCHHSSSEDIFLDGEEGTFFNLREDKVIEETTALLKKKSQNDAGHNYKLGETEALTGHNDVYRFSISVSVTDRFELNGLDWTDLMLISSSQ